MRAGNDRLLERDRIKPRLVVRPHRIHTAASAQRTGLELGAGRAPPRLPSLAQRGRTRLFLSGRKRLTEGGRALLFLRKHRWLLKRRRALVFLGGLKLRVERRRELVVLARRKIPQGRRVDSSFCRRLRARIEPLRFLSLVVRLRRRDQSG
jgi:hypothetical protein